jgi:hypothetical protein
MRAPTGEFIFVGETMRFWSMQSAWLVPLRAAAGLDVVRIALDSQSWLQSAPRRLHFYCGA